MGVPETTSKWWPTIAAMLVVSGLFSSAISYYAKAEATEMIKEQLAAPIAKLDKKTDELADAISNIQRKQLESQTKVDLMLDILKETRQGVQDHNK